MRLVEKRPFPFDLQVHDFFLMHDKMDKKRDHNIILWFGLVQDGAEYGRRVASSGNTLQFFVCFICFFVVLRVRCCSLAEWGTAFWTVRNNSPYITLPLTQHAMHCTLTQFNWTTHTHWTNTTYLLSLDTIQCTSTTLHMNNLLHLCTTICCTTICCKFIICCTFTYYYV